MKFFTAIRNHLYPPEPSFSPEYYSRYRAYQYTNFAGFFFSTASMVASGGFSTGLLIAGIVLTLVANAVLIPRWRVQARRELAPGTLNPEP